MDAVKRMTIIGATLLTAMVSQADTLYVDAVNGQDMPDYGYDSSKPVKTIQRAIDMANSEGDTILVAPGTYAPFNAWGHPAITVQSTGGAPNTVIDGEGKDRCATFRRSSTSFLDGFTLRGGHATEASPGNDSTWLSGGGVCHATVKNCIIEGCAADGSGGGAYGCEMLDTIVRNNNAEVDGGGLARCDYAIRCNIYGNTAGDTGGGSYNTTLTDCVVEGNTAVFGGGVSGAYYNFDSPTNRNCRIVGNTAWSGGGTYKGNFDSCEISGNESTATSQVIPGPGISMTWTVTSGGGGVCEGEYLTCNIFGNKAARGGGGAMRAILRYCYVHDNTADFGGGACESDLYTSLVTGNTAEGNGGGIQGGAIYNCTVTANTAGLKGGGVYDPEYDADDYDDMMRGNGFGDFVFQSYNSIVFGNTATASAESADGHMGAWFNSCVGYLQDSIVTPKASVIYRDPKFVDAASGDYRLSAESPCIDKGNNGYVRTDYDFAKMARIANDTVDMGAYEYGAGVRTGTVRFQPSGNYAYIKSQEESRQVAEGSPVGELPTLYVDTEISGKDSATGFRFLGWFTGVNGDGDRVTAATIVTGDVTYYGYWDWGANTGDEGNGSDPVVPGPVTPGYEVIGENDIAAPYVAPKAVTLQGAAYNGNAVVGIVELKLGKVSKGKSKISGSFAGLDGKKTTFKAVDASNIDGTAPVTVSFKVKGLGTMTVTIGGTQFAGSLGDWHVQSADVGGAWSGRGATVTVAIGDVSMFAGTVVSGLLPADEQATVNGGKWSFAKAASVKWAKPTKGAAWSEFYDESSGKDLIVDDTNGKTNLSGLKLTYTPKKGTFKGSFKVYALEGAGRATKLKKYTVKVAGVVVDGVGYGVATCKTPAVRWAVTVK